ncbi:MAG: flavin reductase family protein [Chloroflexi bacterium]|nr:flavin reductase family protein [Chloroflexota bacterium]
MQRQSVPYDYQLVENLKLLMNPGLLLVSSKPDGTSNVMTIGWATVGIIWGKPIFQAWVRPSRYTYQFIEASQVFTVNVPSPKLRKWTAICGTKSGRDIDKFKDYNIATSPALHVPTITIDQCPMVYECRVVHHNDVIPAHLSDEIETSAYGGNDYHRIYFGEILGTYAAQ